MLTSNVRQWTGQTHERKQPLTHALPASLANSLTASLWTKVAYALERCKSEGVNSSGLFFLNQLFHIHSNTLSCHGLANNRAYPLSNADCGQAQISQESSCMRSGTTGEPTLHQHKTQHCLGTPSNESYRGNGFHSRASHNKSGLCTTLFLRRLRFQTL